MDPAYQSLLVLVVVIGLFIWNRLPVGTVAILTALVLYFTGLVDYQTALSGFGDPVVIFIAALFVVSAGLDASGITSWAGQALITKVGEGRTRLLTAVMILCALLTALVTPNGSVAALLPVVVVLAMRIGQAPSQMLLPLAFSAHAGSLLALTGSVVNVIASDAASGEGVGEFGYFSFAVVGVPLLVVTIVLCLLLGPRLLPRHKTAAGSADFSRHAETLASHYALADGVYRLRVTEFSPYVGRAVDTIDLTPYPGLMLVAVQRGGTTLHVTVVEQDDYLVVSGPHEQVSHLVVEEQLAVAMSTSTPSPGGGLIDDEFGVAEVVVPPRSPHVGRVFYPGMRRGSDLVVLALRRLGKDLPARKTELEEGDLLLLHGTWSAIEDLAQQRDVLVVDDPELVRRQALPLGSSGLRAGLVLLALVVLLTFAVVPPAVAALICAVGMVLTKVLSVAQAYRAVSWQTVVLIGGLIPLSEAIRDSGAADLVAGWLTDAVDSPLLLMAAIFLFTGVLGQVVSNTATALVVVPIAISAASDLGVSVKPILMMVTVAAAASFLTPIATPANMMVMGPANYRFGDYWRLGLVVMATWLAVALAVIPLVWPF